MNPNPGWPQFPRMILDGGVLHWLIYGLIVMTVSSVIVQAFAVARRSQMLRSPVKLTLFAFLPLVFGSCGAFLCFMHIRMVSFSSGLVDPWSIPKLTYEGCYFLYGGSGATAVCLLTILGAYRSRK